MILCLFHMPHSACHYSTHFYDAIVLIVTTVSKGVMYPGPATSCVDSDCRHFGYKCMLSENITVLN